MRKRKIIVLPIIILICIALGILVVWNIENFVQNKQVYYGADLQDVVLVSASGDEKHFKEDCFVFYMSDTCSSCIEKLESIDEITQLKALQQLTIYCVWKDYIPKRAQQNNKVENLSLRGKYKLNNYFPFYFYYKDGQVSYTTEDYHKIIKKIIENVDADKMKMDLFCTLLKGADKEQTCVVFRTDSDEERNKWDKVRIDNRLYSNIVQIKDYSDSQSVSGNFELYKTVFGITSYPSVLYYDGEIKVETVESLQ